VWPELHWWRGSGYWVFWAVAFTGGIIRAVLHWLTPCPGCGVGFWVWELPELKENHKLFGTVQEMKRVAAVAKTKISSMTRNTNNIL